MAITKVPVDMTDGVQEEILGGTTGQVLTKQSAADGDFDWETPSGGGGGDFDANLINGKVVPLWDYTQGTFTQPSQPPNDTYGTAWSSSGKYLAAASQASPFIHLYYAIDNTYIKLPNPSTLPPSNPQTFGLSFANDNWLVVPSSGSPYITIYKINDTGIFTKVANPGTLPVTNGCPRFNPQGTLLATTNAANTPRFLVYSLVNDLWVKLSDPPSIFSETARWLFWSHDGKTLVVLSSSTTETIQLWTVNGTSITKATNPTTQPGVSCNRGAWSKDGKYFAVASGTIIYPYRNNFDGTYTALSTISVPSGSVYGLEFHPNGVKLLANGLTSVRSWDINRNTDTFTISSPNINSPGGTDIFAMAISPDGRNVAYGQFPSPYLRVGQTSSTNPDVSGAPNIKFNIPYWSSK